MRLIQNKRVDPLPLTTYQFKFGEVEEPFRMMQTKEGGSIKPVMRFE